MKYLLKYELDRKDLVLDLLRNNGIEDPEKYLNVDKIKEHDPRLLKNIVEGAQLLIDHLNRGSKIYLQPD